MKKESILILGAKSDVGIAIAHRFAKENYDIQLAARNVKSLINDVSNIKIRYGVSITLHEFDVLKPKLFIDFVENLPKLPQIVVCTIGLMGNQFKSEHSVQSSSIIFRSNFEGPANILGIFANYFIKRGGGTIVGISSVAGERGRASNYIYGSSKAGFTAYLSGLRNRVSKKNVHILTVIPGYIYTKMTDGLNLPAFLTCEPSYVSEVVFKGIRNKRSIIFVPKIWRYIMMIIKCIPENIFKYSKL